MNHEDLIENLGTIARSGTQEFLTQLSGDAKKDMALIGQFGVGFYSAFMVSDKVEVVTRKAGEAQAWKWVSDGKGQFAIEESERGGIPYRVGSKGIASRKPPHFEGVVCPGTPCGS